MKRRTKLILTAILSVLCAFFFSVGVGCDGCGCGCGAESVFATFTDTIEFSEDYTLTKDDVKATKGDDSVKISKPVTFKLNGHTLNLNGYTLDIGFDGEGVVDFQGKGGKIENGTLKVVVPNGDINFEAVTLADSVTSDLHAASDTIRFANAKIVGKSTIKSNTNVEIKYSSVENITLDGNATLSANAGAKLGSLTVSETAKNAKVNVDSKASVNAVELKAPVAAKINGTVNAFTVAESAKANAEDTFIIEIGSSANVTKVELKAAASLDISGKITKLSVAETANDNANNFEIKVKEDAVVEDVTLKAKTSIEVSGEITQMLVDETAVGASVNFTETASAGVAIVVKAEDTAIDSHNEITVHVVETVQSVQLGEEITKTAITAEQVNEIIKHIHIWLVTSSVDADCTNGGEITYGCENCDEKRTTYSAPLGHDWEYKVIEEPTEIKAGRSIRTCKRCGASEEIAVKAIDSIAVKGLNAIASLMGDGSYTVDVKGGINTSDKGAIAKVNDIKFIINSKDGKLSGSLEVNMSVVAGSNDFARKMDILVEGKLENECLTAYVVAGDDEFWATIPVEFIIETLMGELGESGGMAAITSLISTENLDKAEKTLTAIAEKLNGKLVLKEEAFTTLERNVLGLVFKTTEDGENKVYSYDAETLAKIGDMKTVEVINAVLGEHAYADLKAFVVASLDKTAFTAFTDLMSYAVQHNLTAQDVIDVLNIIQAVMPADDSEEAVTLADMFTMYGNMTVSDILAGVMGIEGDDPETVKETVKQTVNGFIAIADNMVEAPVSTYLGMIPPKYMAIAGMVKQIVDMYCDSISFTLDKDNKLVAYEIKLATPDVEDEEMAAGMPKIDFTFTWAEGANIELNFDIDFMGTTASLKDIENGKELKVGVNGIEADVKAVSEKDGEYKLIYDVDAEEQDMVDGEFTLTITANGLDVASETTVDTKGEETKVNFTVGVEKGEPVDELIQVETIDYSGLQNFEITDDGEYQKVTYKLQHIVDENGSRYELTKTEYRFGEWDQVWENGELKRTADGKILYVGNYIEETSVSVLKEFNGAIDAAIMAQGDCKDWYRLSFAATGVKTTKYYGDTTFVFENERSYKQIVVTLGNELEDLRSERSGVQNYNFYYNPAIAKAEGNLNHAIATESQHNFEYTYKFLGKSGVCTDGVTVTRTCTGCGLSYSYDTNYCDYDDEYHTFTTMCGEDSVEIRTCKACGSSQVYFSIDTEDHTFIGHSQESLTQDKLTAAGLDGTGLYYGYVRSAICADCELAAQVYTWYTYNDGVCKKHTAVALTCPEKNGDDYHFDAVEIKEEGVCNEHYNTTVTKYNAGVSEAVRQAGLDLLPAAVKEIMTGYNQIAVEEYKCKGCGKLQTRYYTFAINKTIDNRTVTVKTCYLNVYYKNDKINNYSYIVNDYDLTDIIAKAAEYNIPVSEDVPYAVIRYYYGSSYYKSDYDYNEEAGYYISTPSSSEHRFEMTFEVNKAFTAKSAYANYYDFLNCQVVRYSVNVKSKTATGRTETWHSITRTNTVIKEGINCRESVVVTSSDICVVCGTTFNTSENVRTWHNDTYWFDSEILSEYGPHLTDDYNVLSGLSAHVNGRYCNVCGCFTECSLSLDEDWTLTADVIIRAEEFHILLNGHTIDLNGHELRIYAFAGTDLVISDAGNYDEGRIGFVDSKGNGLLVVFSNEGLIDFGSVGVSCQVFISDCDTLSSIDDSIASGENNIADVILSGDDDDDDDDDLPVNGEYEIDYDDPRIHDFYDAVCEQMPNVYTDYDQFYQGCADALPGLYVDYLNEDPVEPMTFDDFISYFIAQQIESFNANA